MIVTPAPLPASLLESLHALQDELIAFRRDIHAHPEVSWRETRTSEAVAARLEQAGLNPERLEPTGVIVDFGAAEPTVRVGLRADIDALPLTERTDLPFRSQVEGVSHSCGHDVHTTALLGATLALAQEQETLERLGLAVRCIFQPAEESMPGGARALLDLGRLEGVDAIYAVHCDPRRDVGQVGIRRGPITAASDEVHVILRGAGGHTSRPHLTQDVTYALAKIVTELPAVLTRRLDPRSSAALIWGAIHSGAAPNVIPEVGECRGTLRMLDAIAWDNIGPLLEEIVQAVAQPYGVQAELRHTRGVPPVVNTPEGAETLRLATLAVLGPEAVQDTEQSLGGEDFAWMLQGRQGALARLGTRTPGGLTFDLHRGDLQIDEAAILHGAKLFAALPFAALEYHRIAGEPVAPTGARASSVRAAQ